MKFLFVTQKRLVLRIQAKKKQKSTEPSECNCYACMYALYGLSEDEIKIVEGR